MRTFTIIYIMYLSIMQVVTILAYFLDKKKAQAKMYRTKEIVLLSLSLFGGAYAGYTGMFTLHHKTRKWYFHVINIIGIIIHTTFVILLIKQVQ